jgi:hypothetical protein
VIALLCAVSTSSAPSLVRVKNEPRLLTAQASPAPVRTHPSRSADQVFHPAPEAVSKSNSGIPPASLVQLASFTAGRKESPNPAPARHRRPPAHSRLIARFTRPRNAAGNPVEKPSPDPAELDAKVARTSEPPGDVSATRYGVVLVVMTREEMTSAGSVTWQVSLWELHLPAPTKPIPRKT